MGSAVGEEETPGPGADADENEAREAEEFYTDSTLTALNITMRTMLGNRLVPEAVKQLELRVYDETIRFNILLIDGAKGVVQPYLPQSRLADSATFVLTDNTASDGLIPSSTRCSPICGSGAHLYDDGYSGPSTHRRAGGHHCGRDHQDQAARNHGQGRSRHGHRSGGPPRRTSRRRLPRPRDPPRSTFLGEEEGISRTGDGLMWAFDPLDGTTNFLTESHCAASRSAWSAKTNPPSG